MGQGPPDQEQGSLPGRRTNNQPSREIRTGAKRASERFSNFAQLAPHLRRQSSAPRARRDASPARATRGCLACSTPFESSQRAWPKSAAQTLQPTSPRAFAESCSRGAAVRPVPLPARSAPGHSHSPRGAPGRGAAAAAGGESRSGRVRQGGRCSPRGGAAPSGRAPARGGGSCNSGSGGRVCPEQWGEGGAGRGRTGAGTGERGPTLQGPGSGLPGGGGRGHWGSQGRGGAARPRGCLILPPSSAPVPGACLDLPPTYAVCGLLGQKLLEAPQGSSSQLEPRISSFCGSGWGAWVIRPRPPAWRGPFEFSLNPGTYTSNSRPLSPPHLVPELQAAAPISRLAPFGGPPAPPPTKPV